MNLLKYIERQNPPDDWRWKCKTTGHRIRHPNKKPWLAAIEKFCTDNGIGLEPNWREIAEHEACLLMPPGFCKYQDGSEPRAALHQRGTVETVLAGTQVLIAFAASGGKLVAPEVAEERAKTCAACFASVPMEGCGGCASFVGTIMEAVGKGTTSSDHLLKTKSCAWCGCSALANVWMPIEASEKGVTDEMLRADLPHCWKLNEIKALRSGESVVAS